jgi:hypothetical protein
LYGTFIAETEGQYDPNLPLFNGKYPYYVKVKAIDGIKQLKNSKSFFNKLGISRKDYLSYKGVSAIVSALGGNLNIKKSKDYVDKDYRPP